MAITYTWTVTGIKTTTEGSYQNSVIQTYWKKIGTDENGNTGEFAGATPFTSANVAAEAFVPFNELTEEIVLGWIKAVVIGDYERHVNAQILKSIRASSIVEQPLPWDPTKGVVGTPAAASDNVENGNNPP
jgi:hypothetical protein